jgi:hypothetical protein
MGASNEKSQIVGDVSREHTWSRVESSRSVGLEEDRYSNSELFSDYKKKIKKIKKNGK